MRKLPKLKGNSLSSNLSKSNFIPSPCWWKDDALHRVFAFYAGWRPWAAQAKGSINCACYIPTLHSALWDKGVEVMSSVLHNDPSYIVVVSVLAQLRVNADSHPRMHYQCTLDQFVLKSDFRNMQWPIWLSLPSLSSLRILSHQNNTPWVTDCMTKKIHKLS